MCGILVLVDAVAPRPVDKATGDAGRLPALADFIAGLKRRGPDAVGSHLIQLPSGSALTLTSSLLQLRGIERASVPTVDSASGNVLLWNGEIFGGLNVPPGTNDAACLLQALTSAQPGDVPALLSRLRGPWAFVFWHAATQKLFFGRDVLGRRSLLLHRPSSGDSDPRLLLTSSYPLDPSCPMLEYEELRPGLYSINFSADIPVERLEITDIPWLDAVVARIARFERPAAHLEAAQLATQPLYDGAPEVTAATEGVLRVLRRAVEARCLCTDSRPGSTPSTEGATGDDGHPPARVMILFSGGLDSSLLAALANEALPPEEPIDLVSICFAGGTSPDRLAALDAVAELRAMAPGRLWRLLAADRSLEDAVQVKEHLLRLLAPSDTVMDFNIGAALWLAAEGSGYIVPAGHAGRAAASETACNGQQNLEKEALQEPEKVMYRSAARVVLLGHGADELFGGYGRHRTRFREGSWQGLSDELALDVRRLWVRNLGRDDRLIADRGKEARHPFLDEAVILESLSHPLHALVDLRSAPGEGDKRVLRECLRQLGMPRAAQRVKRAIQFGSRLAKASNAAQFGGTKRANAKNAGSVRLGEAGAES